MTNKPFESDSEDTNEGPNKTKLDPKKSRFHRKNTEEKESIEKLEEKVSEHQKEEQEILQEIHSLSSRFIGFIRTKTLKENKSPIESSVEAETVQGLVQMALKLNNDQTQPEGIGSVGVITLLLKSVLAQRDIINNLEFKVSQLEKIVKKT